MAKGTQEIDIIQGISNSILDSIMENIDEGVAITDELGRIVYLNRAAKTLLGDSEIIGKTLEQRLNFFNIRDSQERPVSPEELPSNRSLRGEQLVNQEIIIRTPKGKKFLNFKSLPVYTEGSITGALLLFTDITDAKRIRLPELKNKQEMMLNKIGRICNSTLNTEEMIAKIAQNIKDFVECDSVVILTSSEDQWILRTSAGMPIPPESRSIAMSDFSSAAKTLHTKRTLILNSPRKGDSGYQRIFGKEQLRSYAIFPIVFGGEIQGLISINNTRKRRKISHNDVVLVTSVSHHISIALEKARVLEEQKRKTSELEVVNLMSTEIIRGLEIDRLLDHAAKIISKLVPSDGSAIYIFDPFAKRITNSFFDLIPTNLRAALTENELILKIIRSKRPILINNESKIKAEHERLYEQGLCSFIGLPIMFEDTVIGALCSVGLKPEHKFDPHDIELFQSLGRNISIAIKNAELFEEHKEISSTLQMSLLPEVPLIEGIDLGVHYESATRRAMIGGDFYDFFKISDDEYGIVVGDISGKGIGAAADSTLVKNILKGFAMEGYVLVDVMRHLNRWITRQMAEEKFATLIFAVYNKALSTVIYANAGHPYPLIFGTRRGFIRESDLVIGIDPDQTFKLISFRIEPGEIIVFYTDGLIEAKRGKEVFGENRLVRTVRDCSQLKAQEIADALCHRAAEFTRKELTDDILTVVLRKR